MKRILTGLLALLLLLALSPAARAEELQEELNYLKTTRSGPAC